jgi:ABC-type xylose transport system permease subunit
MGSCATVSTCSGPSFLQQIVIGGVIVVAVLLDTVLKRKYRA